MPNFIVLRTYYRITVWSCTGIDGVWICGQTIWNVGYVTESKPSTGNLTENANEIMMLYVPFKLPVMSDRTAARTPPRAGRLAQQAIPSMRQSVNLWYVPAFSSCATQSRFKIFSPMSVRCPALSRPVIYSQSSRHAIDLCFELSSYWFLPRVSILTGDVTWVFCLSIQTWTREQLLNPISITKLRG